MASSLIHVAIASEVNKKLKRNESALFIGSLAPSLYKQVGGKKQRTHFIDEQFGEIPNIKLFLDKYKKYLKDDFVLGYYLHLYTDYLWNKYFLPEIYTHNIITTLNDKVVRCNKDEMKRYIYSDYTNLNTKILNMYNINLNVFYNELPKFKEIIEEIPMDKIDLIAAETSVIIENSKKKKQYLFDEKNIKQFIDTAVLLILSKLEELGIK